jgi:hypothetical protein
MSHKQAYLGATIALAFLTCAAAKANAPTAVSAILGIALFAATGYLLSQLLLGCHIGGLERVAVATALALCVPILGGLLLHLAGLRLDRASWLGLLAGVTLTCDVVLFLRHRGSSTRFSWSLPWSRLPMRQAGAFAAAGVIAIGGVGLARVGVALQHYPGYTQLWLVRPNEDAQTINLGVGNHEGRTIRYRLVLGRNGRPTATWNLTLTNGEGWHRSLQYPSRYNMSANLYRLPDLSQPYRHVALDGNGKTLP